MWRQGGPGPAAAADQRAARFGPPPPPGPGHGGGPPGGGPPSDDMMRHSSSSTHHNNMRGGRSRRGYGGEYVGRGGGRPQQDYVRGGGGGPAHLQWDQQSQRGGGANNNAHRRVSRGPSGGSSTAATNLARMSSTDSEATPFGNNRGGGSASQQQILQSRALSVFDNDGAAGSRYKSQMYLQQRGNSAKVSTGSSPQGESGDHRRRKESGATPRDGGRSSRVDPNRTGSPKAFAPPPPPPQQQPVKSDAVPPALPKTRSSTTTSSSFNAAAAYAAAATRSQMMPRPQQQQQQCLAQPLMHGPPPPPPPPYGSSRGGGGLMTAAEAAAMEGAVWGQPPRGATMVHQAFLSPIQLPPPSKEMLLIDTPPQFDYSHKGPNPLALGPPLKLTNLSLLDYIAILSRPKKQLSPLLKRQDLDPPPPPPQPPSTAPPDLDDQQDLDQRNPPHPNNLQPEETPSNAPPRDLLDAAEEPDTNRLHQTPTQQPPNTPPKPIIRYSLPFMLSLRDQPTPKDFSLPFTYSPTSHKDVQRHSHQRRRSLPVNANVVHSPSSAMTTPWLQAKTNEAEHPPSEQHLMTRSIGMTNKQHLPKTEMFKRNVKSLLNRMTIEKFVDISDSICRLLEQVECVEHLKVIVDEVYKKSVSEPNFSEMYADLVLVLRARSPSFPAEDPKGKPEDFQRAIIIRCETEFREMDDFSKLNLPEEMLAEMDEDDIEIERKSRKQRTLGNMRFIGELFTRRVLKANAVHEILTRVITGKIPEAYLVECICELLSTIGCALENVDNRILVQMSEMLEELRTSGHYEKRIEYLIQDLLELREAGWRKKTGLFNKTRAKALLEIRQHAADSEWSDTEVAGQESNHPYKEYVRYWNDTYLTKKKDLRQRRAEQAAANAALLVEQPPVPAASGGGEDAPKGD